MKTKFLALIISLFITSSVAFAQDSPFRTWQNEKEVEATYITKSMFDLMPDMKIGNAELFDIRDKLDLVEIYTSYAEGKGFKDGSGTWSPRPYDQVKSQAVTLAGAYDYNLVMQLRNESKLVIFYAKNGEKKGTLDLILINTDDVAKKCTVIRMLGSFTMEDIQDLIVVPKEGANQSSVANNPLKDLYNKPVEKTFYDAKLINSKIPNIKIGNRNLSDLQDKLEQAEIYVTGHQKGSTPLMIPDVMMNDAIREAERNNYKMIALSNDNPQKQILGYAKADENSEEVFKDVILIRMDNTYKGSVSDGKCTVVRLVGSFTKEDIEGLAAM